jgi:membrane-bound serine protease (ClpP class)
MKAASLRALLKVAGAIGMALAAAIPLARGVSANSAGPAPAAPSATPQATVLEIKGAIGPATSHYVVRGIESAQKAGARLVILEMDTPGGLDGAMRDIIRAILASTVPVATYVSPPGARAASAGTYILYASHIAAMAPATNLGAATPVSIGGEPAPEPNPPGTNPTSKPDATSKPDSGTDSDAESGQATDTGSRTHADSAAKQSRAAKRDAATKPDAAVKPDAATKPDSSTKPDSMAKRDSTRKPDSAAKHDSGRNPDSAAKSDQSDSASSSEPSDKSPAQQFPVPSTAMERKVINDAVAYIRGLAELRGRNAEWAEQAVRGAASLSATAALKEKVIDVIARDVPELLTQIDGREVKIGNRTERLATRDLPIERVKPDWRTELLAVITNPTIAYGLMLIGIYGLLFEGYNPGAVLPGVVGTIALLLALFAFQILSVNYAGLALVALGVGMIIAEFFFPAFGSLGLGGLIAFVVGSLILFDTDVPGMNIALPVIGAVATVGGLVIVGIVYIAARAIRRPVVTGVQGMIGDTAEVLQSFTGRGRVRYRGELWNARSNGELHAGETARIVKVEGLTLWVERS